MDGETRMSEPTTAVAVCINPVFVIGSPRSGTSALAKSLAKHDGLWGSAESNFISYIEPALRDAYHYGTQRGPRHWLSREKVQIDEFLHSMGIGINALFTRYSQGKVWVEQTPEYTIHLPLMNTMFPGARFLHLLRDGREVVNSMINSGFPTAFARNFKVACQTWVQFVRAALDFAAEHAEQVLDVRYENLCDRAEDEFDRILTWLGQPGQEDVAQFFKTGKRMNSSFTGHLKTLADGNAGAYDWRSAWSKRQKSTCQKVCGDLLRQLGYASTTEQ